MIAGFFIAMFSGHIYIIGIVTAVQIVSFKEVIAIANVPSKEKNIRFTKSLNWYFLGTSMYFLYGESVIYYFKHILLVDRVLLPLATHHRFISFTLWIMGMSLPRLFCCRLSNTGCRFCFLCCFSAKGPLPVPVHPIRMDSYGIVLDCRSGAFCYEQHPRGHDLVLPPRISGHHK